MFDADRLQAAYETVRADLLAERNAAGHWVGELSSSALSTATAVSALTLVARHDDGDRGRWEKLIASALRWLVDQQNDDGGWGDTDKSYSNVATTMLVKAVFHLAGVHKRHASQISHADEYIASKGNIAGLRKRYGRDKTFAVPILTNCALAGLVRWREVSPLPFEAACVPQPLYRFLRLPVVSYAIPALVAMGQARYFHKKPWNPLTRLLRAASVNRSLKVLERMQPESGGFLEAIPLTSFVVMSLAATGRASHAVTRRGVDFLLATVRSDGSWPIDTNLATWNTTLAINALQQPGCSEQPGCLDWLLDCQHSEVHPFTGAQPGGWGWSDLSGAVPDADDTPGALLALACWHYSPSCEDRDRERIHGAAVAGVRWLLDLQNRDGGWPTFCRGWGKLPFDRSGCDLTAHALRALWAWRSLLGDATTLSHKKFSRAIEKGLRYLAKQQRADGSWMPIWFGNQDHPHEENPVYGTAKVLLAYRAGAPGHRDGETAEGGLLWLAGSQNGDGSWGSVEETALATEALLSFPAKKAAQVAARKGLEWLMDAVENGRHWENAPIGFYFAKLWYYEKLYPLIFTASALGHAVRSLPVQTTTPAAASSSDV